MSEDQRSTEPKIEGRRDPSELDTRIRFYNKFGVKRMKWYPWVLEHISLSQNDVVLELGCGSGDLWQEARETELTPERIVLSDLEMAMVEDSRNELEDCPYEFEYICCDAGRIPFPPDQFDVIIANHVLHLVDDPDAVLGEIVKTLNPDGRLYATTKSEHNFRGLNQILNKYDDIDMNQMGGFTLEGADEILSQYFQDVSMDIYSERLQVDDVNSLVEFVRSRSDLDSKTRQQFIKHASRELHDSAASEEGQVLLFEKDMCLFTSEFPKSVNPVE